MNAKKAGKSKRTRPKSAGKTRLSKSAGRVLDLLAVTATNFQANTMRMQALLAVSAKLVTQSYETPSDEGDGEQNGINEELLKDLLEALAQRTDPDEFTAPCRDMLEGMRQAIEAGDNKAAAGAYFNYIRCMLRPRPLVVGG